MSLSVSKTNMNKPVEEWANKLLSDLKHNQIEIAEMYTDTNNPNAYSILISFKEVKE
jgi:hypothetical protein